MTKEASRKLAPGLYRLRWKEGGSSLAAVGILHCGTRWFAPTNWSAALLVDVGSEDWQAVESVEPIAEAS